MSSVGDTVRSRLAAMLGFSVGLTHIADIVSRYRFCGRKGVMTEGYRLITVFKALLRPQNDRVGRPMSLRAVIIVWLVLLSISLYGAYDFYFGA